MAFIDWSTGDIALRDMASGRIDRLMAKRGSWEQSPDFAEWPLLSPDQKQLAYAWLDRKLDRYQFRLMPNQRGARARTLVDGPQFEYFVPAGWSTDGKSVLATIWGQDKTAQIGWISAETGAIRTLRSLEWRDPWVSLSPDGQYVAYLAFSNNESTNRQLYLLAADGSSEVVLDDGPGAKDSPVWTPDGNHVVYVSDQAGSNGFWAVRVKNGKPAGAPQLVHRSTGHAFLRGFTRAGTLFYFQRNVAANEFWIAKVDPAGRIVQADGERIRTGMITTPSWSPDSRLVAFHAWRRGVATIFAGPGSDDVVVRDLETGVEKVYPLNQRAAGRVSWAPDGTSLYQLTRDRQRKGHVLRLDLNSGKWTEVLGLSVPPQWQYVSPLSPELRTLYNVEVPEDPKRPVIAAYDVASGQRREVYRFQDGISSAHVVAVSPDGRHLALRLTMGPVKRAIAVVGADGAGFQQIWESTTPPGGMQWSPDGQWLYFVQTAEGQKHRLMRIAAQGGEPQETGLTAGRIGVFQFSRDSSRILYAGSDSRDGSPECWALDNLTSILNRSK
ncbi:MAG: PD40 domain-containing protein [Bryobacterales bacterium]|nr:PD40 domain-containing protein [Bryobacterales bacterium]